MEPDGHPRLKHLGIAYWIGADQKRIEIVIADGTRRAPGGELAAWDDFVDASIAPAGGPKEVASMLYFSLTTLTTTGYGDIVAVDPFARSLANLEAVIGQFYLAITVARLVTLELADRRR